MIIFIPVTLCLVLFYCTLWTFLLTSYWLVEAWIPPISDLLSVKWAGQMRDCLFHSSIFHSCYLWLAHKTTIEIFFIAVIDVFIICAYLFLFFNISCWWLRDTLRLEFWLWDAPKTAKAHEFWLAERLLEIGFRILGSEYKVPMI